MIAMLVATIGSLGIFGYALSQLGNRLLLLALIFATSFSHFLLLTAFVMRS